MKLRRWMLAWVACLPLLLATGLGTAWALEADPGGEALQLDERYRVLYRCEYQGEDETSRSGLAIVVLLNQSGQPLREASARIPEFSASPFGHLPIQFGEVADGQAKEVVIPFISFKSDVDETAVSAIWQLEFLDPLDVPVAVEVQGEMSL